MKLKLWNEWKNRQLDTDHQLKVFHLPFTYLSFPYLLSASGGRSEWTTSIWLLWNECSYKRGSKESLLPHEGTARRRHLWARNHTLTRHPICQCLALAPPACRIVRKKFLLFWSYSILICYGSPNGLGQKQSRWVVAQMELHGEKWWVTANGYRFLLEITKCSKIECGDSCTTLWIY